MGEGGLFGSLLRMGKAYMQHTQFAQTVLSADKTKRFEALQTYVRDLSDASFGGLKMTLAMLMNNEGDASRKQLLQALLNDADRARGGQPSQSGTAQLQAAAERQPEPPANDPEADVPRLNGWFDLGDDDRRMTALLDHLMTLNQTQYNHFAQNVRYWRDNKIQAIKNHDENERYAWGTYFEDQMAYFAAKQKTGAQDPTWVKAHAELKSHLKFLEWTMQASEGAWEVIAKKKGK